MFGLLDDSIVYVLGAFAYPSGPIHMGHVRVYSIVNAIVNLLNVYKHPTFNPIGFDSMGLPAEAAAIERNLNPYEWIEKCIHQMSKDLQDMQFNFTSHSFVNTARYHYAKMEQVIFQKMFEKKLVYFDYKEVPFCNKCNTTLSKEQSEGNVCWRCGLAIEYQNRKQIFIRTSNYSRILFDNLNNLSDTWTQDVINKQKAWLGCIDENNQFINRLTDWCVSRERSFGIPIPLSECEECGLFLEDVSTYTLKSWPNKIDDMSYRTTQCRECGKIALKVPFTLDTFFDSSWYMSRFNDCRNTKEPFKKDSTLQVKFYICGKEHTNLHLIYARFIQIFLYENNMVTHLEPFQYLITQGLVLAESKYCHQCNKYLCQIDQHIDHYSKKIEKMSKSKKNGVSPRNLLKIYTADMIKMSLLFLGPVYKDVVWDEKCIVGVGKLLNEIDKINIEIHFIKNELDVKIDQIIENNMGKLYRSLYNGKFYFNAVAAQNFIIFNLIKNDRKLHVETCKNFLRMLYVFAPNIAQNKYFEIFQLQLINDL